MGRSRSAMAKQLRETASHSLWRCFPCLKTTTFTLLCNAQEPPSVTSVCYYRREVEVLSFHGVSSLGHLERFHDCATLHFFSRRGDECDVGNTARGFFVFVPSGHEYQNQRNLWEPQVPRYPFVHTTKSFHAQELVGQATFAPHTEEARPKECVWCIPGASSFVVVSFRNTICELATDNSGAVSPVCTCTHGGRARGAH